MTYLILFLSGLASSLPFLAPKLWLIEWFSLIPLFFLAPRIGKRYLHGLCFGMGFYLPIYYWFLKLYPMDFVGFTPLEGGLTVMAGWIGLSVIQAAEIALIPVVYARLHRPASKEKPLATMWNPFLAASCFVIFEWAQSLFWHGVPWARLALSQVECLPMIQSASLFGSMFICFLIVLTNGLLANAIRPREVMVRSKKKIAIYLLLVMLVPLSNGLFGAVRIQCMDKESSNADTVRVALIQGNIASGDKWQDDSLSASVTKYLDMSREVIDAESPDIVLWPETVLTVSLDREPYYLNKLITFAKQNSIMLVTGAYASDDEGNLYNALYAIYADGSVDEHVYKKRHLVPFGEYLPMPWLFNSIPFLAELNLSDNALTAGSDSELFTSPYGAIGGLVCFDSIYDELARSSAADGAQLLLLSTNDSWYRDSRAVYQHNSHAILRAVENGRSIARAANTGISTLILPSGEVISSLDPLVTGTLCGDLPLSSEVTLYQRVGNLIVWLSMAFVFVRLLVVSAKHIRPFSKTH